MSSTLASDPFSASLSFAATHKRVTLPGCALHPDPHCRRGVKTKPIEVKLSDFGHSKLVRDGYTYARSHVGAADEWG